MDIIDIIERIDKSRRDQYILSTITLVPPTKELWPLLPMVSDSSVKILCYKHLLTTLHDYIPELSLSTLSSVLKEGPNEAVSQYLKSKFKPLYLTDEIIKELKLQEPGYKERVADIIASNDYHKIKKYSQHFGENLEEHRYYKQKFSELDSAMNAFYTTDKIYAVGDLRPGGTVHTLLKSFSDKKLKEALESATIPQIEVLINSTTPEKILTMLKRVVHIGFNHYTAHSQSSMICRCINYVPLILSTMSTEDLIQRVKTTRMPEKEFALVAIETYQLSKTLDIPTFKKTHKI